MRYDLLSVSHVEYLYEKLCVMLTPQSGIYQLTGHDVHEE